MHCASNGTRLDFTAFSPSEDKNKAVGILAGPTKTHCHFSGLTCQVLRNKYTWKDSKKWKNHPFSVSNSTKTT